MPMTATGVTDLAVYRSGEAVSDWLIMKSIDASVLAFLYSYSTNKPMPRDYDGITGTDLGHGDWAMENCTRLRYETRNNKNFHRLSLEHKNFSWLNLKGINNKD